MEPTRRREPSRPCAGDDAAVAPVGRRAVLDAALAAGAALALPRTAAAAIAGPKPPRPQTGDRFVFAIGDKAGSAIGLDDLPEGGPQVLVWPVDPETNLPRDASRLAQVLLVKLDPTSLDDATREHSAEGVVAYSATCTHAQCAVMGWSAEKKRFHCPCHNSEYDPAAGAKVTFGPAPRSLPALPVRIENGELIAAGTFTGRVGTSST